MSPDVVKTKSELSLTWVHQCYFEWMLDLKITFVTYAQITDFSYNLNTDQLIEFNDMYQWKV